MKYLLNTLQPFAKVYQQSSHCNKLASLNPEVAMSPPHSFLSSVSDFSSANACQSEAPPQLVDVGVPYYQQHLGVFHCFPLCFNVPTVYHYTSTQEPRPSTTNQPQASTKVCPPWWMSVLALSVCPASPAIINQVVVSTQFEKYAKVKLDHFRKDRGEHFNKYLKSKPSP